MKEYQLTLPNGFIVPDPLSFIPYECRKEVAQLLLDAFRWRGWDALAKEDYQTGHATRAIRDICNLIQNASGVAFMEYT